MKRVILIIIIVCMSSRISSGQDTGIYDLVDSATEMLNSGRIKEAEPLFNQALNIAKQRDINSEEYRYVLYHMALFYGNIGDWDRARISASDAKILYERNLDRGANYVLTLITLSHAAYESGHGIMARSFMFEALNRVTHLLGSGEEYMPLFVYCFRESGLLELKLGSTSAAITTFEVVIKLNKKYNLRDSYSTFLLGIAYSEDNNPHKAKDVLSQEYINIQNVSTSVRAQIGLHLLNAKYLCGDADLLPLAKEISSYHQSNVSSMFSFLSSEERSNWWLSPENAIMDLVNAIILDSNDESCAQIVTNNVLFSKGLLLRAENKLRNLIVQKNDIEMLEKLEQLESLKTVISNQQDISNLGELRNKATELEKELLYAVDLHLDEITQWQQIESAIGKGEAAVEFIKLPRLNTESSVYYAIIIRKGDKNPSIIELCEEEPLSKVLRNTANLTTQRYVQRTYTTTAERLYELIWSKLEQGLRGIKKIYYSPTGLMNTVSIKALSYKGKYLCDRYELHMVSSIANIPNIKSSTSALTSSAVFGGIIYDADSDKLISEARAYDSTPSDIWTLSRGEERSGWSYLKGTEKESLSINDMLQSKGVSSVLKTGIEANEESFKALSGNPCDIIHVATHGFFLSMPKEIRKSAFLHITTDTSIEDIDPMKRSGLLFAGANAAWTGIDVIPNIEDGILTASEIANLNLSGTNMVVLSACETGLGEIVSNEGVFGLQRAFKLAGVESLVMSLWEVPDDATSLLMTTFYRNYLNGRPKHEAFDLAVRTVRNFKNEDNEWPYKEPYYWAGFVMLD